MANSTEFSVQRLLLGAPFEALFEATKTKVAIDNRDECASIDPITLYPS